VAPPLTPLSRPAGSEDSMANHFTNDAAFELPERTFVDKTVHGLESRLPDGKTLAVFVHRRPIDGTKSLRALVDDNIALNHKRLSAFAVLDDVQASVGGLPGHLVRTRWRLDGAELYQRQAHVAFEGKWMIFAVSGPLDHQAACDETFDVLV
jgi:hypothetical protein